MITVHSVRLESEIIQPGHIPRAPLVLSPILIKQNETGIKGSESHCASQDDQEKVAQFVIYKFRIIYLHNIF